MHLCVACQQRATDALLCRSCLARPVAQVVWSQVYPILPEVGTLCAQADPQPILQARRAFFTAVRAIPVPPEAVTPMPSAVPVQVAQQNIPVWTAYEGLARTYRQQVSQASPAWEFRILLDQAQQQCRHAHYVLLARDGFDVAQWGWLPGYFPLTAEARTAHLMTRRHYETWARLLHSGLLMLILGLQAQLPLLAAVQGAASVMREEELTSLPLTLMWMSTLPPSPVQQWAQAALAGWGRAQIHEYLSLRTARAAQQLSDRHLLAFLFDQVGQGQQEGVETPKALLAILRRKTNALRRTGLPRGRPTTPKNITSHPMALDQSALQAWQTADRAQRLIDNVPLDAIPLGPQEQRVLALYLQGETSQQIAERLGMTLSTVRSHLSHARQKQQTGKRQRKKRPS